MDRRTVLKLFSLVTSFVPTVTAYSNMTKPINRLALVVGINKVQDSELATLKGAASDARKIANWLGSQGFTVKLFVDQKLNPDGTSSENYNNVTVRDIKEEINPILENEPIKELVIYFSGHGYNSRGDIDFLLLSNAPRETDEAINLSAFNTAVKKFRIKNVTYIIDACRSTSKHLTVQDLVGSPVLYSPGRTASIPRSLDTIFAATRGDQAYEISSAIDAHNKGVFTSTFLSAYSRPWLSMIKIVNGKQVVPNRKLTDFLREEIPLRARQTDITLEQYPEVQVNADDDYFLGDYSGTKPIMFDDTGKYLSSCWPGIRHDKYGDCVLPNTGSGAGPVIPWPPAPIYHEIPTVRDIANFKFDSSLPFETNESNFSAIQLDVASRELGVDKLYRLITDQLKDVSSITSNRYSVLVVGDNISDCLFVPSGIDLGFPTEASELINGMSAVENVPSIGSIVIRFGSGIGIVVANIPDYICTVLTDGKEITSVAYRKPSVSGDVLDRVAFLQAQVATISNVGSFKIEGTGRELENNARRFSSALRTEKASDPTLAIYAAYAYEQANLLSKIQEMVIDHQQRYSIFDIELLAENLNNKFYPFKGVSPFCPMFTQGWGLLEVNEVIMPEFLNEAMRHLNDSLWTCFNEKGIEIVMDHFLNDR